MPLVIVESPTKSKTLEGFLGPKYKVRSCFGHIRDLPKTEFGIDIFNISSTICQMTEKSIYILEG